MTTDLYVLCALGLLAFVLQMLPGIPRTAQPGGLAWGIGNREGPEQIPPWAARTRRAHANLLENLPHYTIVVLALQVSDRANALTATASLVYLGARIAHAIVYAAGITYIRTIAFYVGVAAEIAIASQLFTS
jgi:uncharacterized MAPEG superfamily protein